MVLLAALIIGVQEERTAASGCDQILSGFGAYSSLPVGRRVGGERLALPVGGRKLLTRPTNSGHPLLTRRGEKTREFVARLRFARASDVCPRFHHRVLSSNSPNAVRALPGTSAKQSFAEVRSQTEFGNEGRFSISGLLLLKGRRSRWNPAHLQVPRVMLHYHRRPMGVATR